MTGEYALRAAVCLARHHPAPKTAAEIAELTHVPPGYLSKILQGLARAGLVRSQRGLGGGFHLAREAGAISVLDVMMAAGAPLHREHHCPLGLADHQNGCPLHRLVDEAVRLLDEAFASTTLSSLAASAEGCILLGRSAIRGAAFPPSQPPQPHARGEELPP